MKPTLIFIRSHEIGGRHFSHGGELPPGVLTQKQIDQWLDQGALKEYDSAERRSLYRLLHHFSGCSETERLSAEEYAAFALTE